MKGIFSQSALVLIAVLAFGCSRQDPLADQSEGTPPKLKGADASPGETSTDPEAGPSDSTAATPGVAIDLPPAGGGSSGSGITPFDVISGAPAPAAVAGSASEGETEDTPDSVTYTPENLPPGVPLPDLSGLAGAGNLKLESVTIHKAKPGEGPVGPDGKVVSAEEALKSVQNRPSAGAEDNAAPAPVDPSVPISPQSGSVQVPDVLLDQLPPGVSPADLSNLISGGQTLVLESVRDVKLAPGEGPIGPDGKMVDPDAWVEAQKKAGVTLPKNPAPSSSGQVIPLDPSEAPDPALIPQRLQQDPQ